MIIFLKEQCCTSKKTPCPCQQGTGCYALTNRSENGTIAIERIRRFAESKMQIMSKRIEETSFLKHRFTKKWDS